MPPSFSAITGELCYTIESPSPPLHFPSPIPCHLPKAPVKLLGRTTLHLPHQCSPRSSFPLRRHSASVEPPPPATLSPSPSHQKVRVDPLSLPHPFSLTAGDEPRRNSTGTRRAPTTKDNIARTKFFLGTLVEVFRGLNAKMVRTLLFKSVKLENANQFVEKF